MGDFVNKQKSENTKGRRLLIWTLYSVLLKLMAWIVKQLKAYLRPSLTTFCQFFFFFFMNVRRKNGEYEPATFSSFQRNIQRYLSEKKYPFNILKDNEFEKSRIVLAAKHKSLVHEHDRRNKLQAAQAVDENEEDALFEAGEFGDSNPVALQRTVWWFLFLHFGFRARDESDEDDWLNAATFKVEYDFHSNLFLIRTLWCANKFSGIDETLSWVSKTNRSC